MDYQRVHKRVDIIQQITYNHPIRTKYIYRKINCCAIINNLSRRIISSQYHKLIIIIYFSENNISTNTNVTCTFCKLLSLEI